MKDGIGKLIFVLTIIFILLLFSSPYLFIELWNIQSGRSTIFELTINDIKDDIDSAINKDKYNKILNEYIKNKFGDSLSEKLRIIKNDGWRYVVKFDDIMDETFYIAYNTGKYSCSDNFEQVISNDKKFQHLYSEWVKNQVGIEDENVELEFKGALKGARWVGDEPYIDFSKITSLDNLIEDICKNTHNLYLYSIDKKISNRETKDDWLQTSKMLRDEYVDKIKDFNLSLIWDNEVSVKLYYYDVDLVNDRYNHIGLKKDNTNFYYILFNLQNNDIKYLCNYYDCTGASVLQSWLKEIDD